jgi:hypothetical protein
MVWDQPLKYCHFKIVASSTVLSTGRRTKRGKGFAIPPTYCSAKAGLRQAPTWQRDFMQRSTKLRSKATGAQPDDITSPGQKSLK